MFLTSNLNEMQQTIMRDVSGAVLVSAGAGSGKTRLLTHRILYLMEEKGVRPQNILAITFTNKATNEMRERITAMHSAGKDVFISTFHSMCAKILRDNIHHLEGYNGRFTIYDESDKEKIIKEILKEKDYASDLKQVVAKKISVAKNEGLSMDEFAPYLKYERNSDEIFEVCKLYEERMKKANSLDFDDLLLKTLQLFTTCKQVLDYYSDRFHYIHIDEFQDTNLVQYKIVKLLASKHKNVFVVGDEDQCIYKWRGANIENIRNFIEYYNSKVYKLEQNYRSSKKILNHANVLIGHNTSRIEKTLFTENDEGDDISINHAEDENAEAEYVARNIYNLIASNTPANEIGVLMRLSALSRLVEEKLLNYDIPYRVSGIFKFFERAEVKDILAYFRVVVNNRDMVSLLRIINVPKRSIGSATIDKLQALAVGTNSSLFDVILNIEEAELPRAVKTKVADFSLVLKDLLQVHENLGLFEFANYLIDRTQIKDMYSDGSEESLDKKLNIEQLIQSIGNFAQLNEGGLVEYLESVTLQSSIEEEDESVQKVNVSTIHASKGLEFDHVFIIGAEEGKFPLVRGFEGVEDLEEERRLMYVAITRARKRLFITRAKSRFMYGDRQSTVASRFLQEMGLFVPQQRSGSFETSSFGNNSYRNGFSYNRSGYKKSNAADKNFDYGTTKTSEKTKNNNSSATALAWDAEKTLSKFGSLRGGSGVTLNKSGGSVKYQVGMQVFHLKYGVGTITKIDESGSGSLFISFGSFGVKILSMDAPLKIMPKK